MTDLSDNDLMAQVRAGNARAFDVLYGRMAPMLRSTAAFVMSNAAEADDVAQDAMLQLWRQPERFDPARCSVRAWLVIITKRRAIDRLRGLKARHGAQDRMESHVRHTGTSAVFSVEEDVHREEMRRALLQAIAQLPANQQEVLRLCYFMGFTTRAAADVLGIPFPTLRTRIDLAKKRLWNTLNQASIDRSHVSLSQNSVWLRPLHEEPDEEPDEEAA